MFLFVKKFEFFADLLLDENPFYLVKYIGIQDLVLVSINEIRKRMNS